jgi:hypothetical protein
LAQSRPGTDYERSDVPPRLLAALAAGLAGSIAAVLVGVALAFPFALGPPGRGPTQPLPPQPRLETAPSSDLVRYRAIEQHRLARIDQAMNEVAAQGWSDGK